MAGGPPDWGGQAAVYSDSRLLHLYELPIGFDRHTCQHACTA